MSATVTLADSRSSSHPAPASPPSLVCRVERDWDALTPIRDQWDRLVAATHGEIYFTFDWCRIWWKHYGRGRRLCVLLFTENDSLIGIVPLAIQRLWIGPLPIRVARLLGSDSTIAVLHPPVAEHCAVDIYTRTIQHALDIEGCAAVSFSSLSGEFATPYHIRQACARLDGHATVSRDETTGPHTVFHLPHAFETYLSDLSKSERGNYRRDQRRLTELGSVRLESRRAPIEMDLALDDFAALHRCQWRTKRKLGHFADWPRSLEFTRDLLHCFSAQDRASLDVLSVADQPGVMELNFEFGDTCYWRLPARTVNDELERRGVGRISLVQRIEQLIQRGLRRIEAGPGEYDYKTRLGATSYPLRSLLICRADPWSRARVHLLLAWANALDIGYYKLWFRRLAPRIPWLQRPLWNAWIRTRL